MKYCIVLISRHTGDEIVLGSQYDTIEEARGYAESDNICDVCNGVYIKPIYHENPVWKNKHVGFVEQGGLRDETIT